jgi:hypothetical protein
VNEDEAGAMLLSFEQPDQLIFPGTHFECAKNAVHPGMRDTFDSPDEDEGDEEADDTANGRD